jgi:hypothetical protein
MGMVWLFENHESGFEFEKCDMQQKSVELVRKVAS